MSCRLTRIYLGKISNHRNAFADHFAVVLSCEATAEAVKVGASDQAIERLKQTAWEALIRLDEVVPDGVRDGLAPEFQSEFDRVLAELV